jgi:rhodanese-related sulfurtransferase
MQTENVKFISKEHLKRMMDNNERFILLDVRSAEDYAQGHIRGAKSLPVDELAAKATQMLKTSDNIVVYCGSYVCMASTNAYKALDKLGYKNVHDYKGGMEEWSAAGFPVERGD